MCAEVASCAEIAGRIVESGVAPSAAAGCAVHADGGYRREIGGATLAFFDLASLTKPMTALALARSGVSPALRLSEVVPELAGTRSGALPLELFLAHRAGLAAHLPLWEDLVRGGSIVDALRAAADARADEPLPVDGAPPVYSDLGYILAGLMLARSVGATDAGEAIRRAVAAPFGLEDELGTARELSARGVDLATRAAPTEDVPWRRGVVRGLVHDENAWALSGEGGSGHAGMFGTVSATLAFGCSVLDAMKGRLPFDVSWLVRERPGGTLRAGFDGKSPQGSSAGERFGPRSIGHLGFTGTSLWIDPDAEIVAVLLTNRVHPSRENIKIREARPGAHDALFARALELRR
jgi:CubicO group peptidase (beta-lactamase class C family)